jgi:hypothetical protein
MGLTHRDGLATVLTGAAVLAFAATHESWDVWLIGSSHRWAAVAITLLGITTCALGSGGEELSRGTDAGTATKALAGVGFAALVLAVWSLVSGSLTPLSLLVAATVILWAGATLRHAWHPAHGAATT